MPVKIVTLLQYFLFAVSLGLFVMAALTFTRRRQAPQSGLLVLVMCAEAFYCFGYAQEMAQTRWPEPSSGFVWNTSAFRGSRRYGF